MILFIRIKSGHSALAAVLLLLSAGYRLPDAAYRHQMIADF